jgi:hypothetical protein
MAAYRIIMKRLLKTGKMKDKYKSLRSRMIRFNEWELKYIRGLDPSRRLEQFFVLFEIAQSYDEQKKLKMHGEHLKDLVETQKRLKRAQLITP